MPWQRDLLVRPLLSLCALCLARVCFSTQPPVFQLLRASVVAATYATLCALLLGGIVVLFCFVLFCTT